MSKFQVGDRVRVIADTCCHSQKIGSVVTLEDMGLRTAYLGNLPAWGIAGKAIYISERDIEPIENRKILITTDGITTLARLYEGKKVVDSAETKCSPSDTFDFNIGARLAFDRLIGPVPTTIAKHQHKAGNMEPCAEPAPVPIKLYCVKPLDDWLTVGKVYESTKGQVVVDNGEKYTDFYMLESGYLVPLVKRRAKVGEWVLYEGEVCEVIAMSTCSGSKYVYAQTLNGKQTYSGSSADRPIKRPFTFLEQEEYLVLDGYKPEKW